MGTAVGKFRHENLGPENTVKLRRLDIVSRGNCRSNGTKII